MLVSSFSRDRLLDNGDNTKESIFLSWKFCITEVNLPEVFERAGDPTLRGPRGLYRLGVTGAPWERAGEGILDLGIFYYATW